MSHTPPRKLKKNLAQRTDGRACFPHVAYLEQQSMTAIRDLDKYALSVTARKKHFRRKRAYAQMFLASRHEAVGMQLQDCQETEVLACCTDCGASWYILNRCRLRVCPLCSYEISKQRSAYILAMTKGMKYPKLLTLTMPLWTDNPQDGIKHIRALFAKLRKMKVFAQVKGGAYQIEIKIKPSGYHIHVHTVLDSKFIPYQHLFSAWRKLTGAVAPQVDIRAADTDAAKVYVAKYAAKSADFDGHPDDIVAWYNATDGARLFATFGAWYNVTAEDLLNPEGKTKPQGVCPHCHKAGTIFLASMGWMIYGHDPWQVMEGSFRHGKTDIRPLVDVRALLDLPDQPETTPPTTDEEYRGEW